MKKFLLIIVIVAVATAVAGCILGTTATRAFASEKAVRGSGKIVTKTIEAPDFHAIDASRAVTVIISDKTDNITIEADDNVIEQVVAKAAKGVLKVTVDPAVKSISNVSVKVTVPANGHISSLDASSASKIISQTALVSDKFSMSASSAADIQAAVKAQSCSIDLSSAAKIKAAVEAKNCTIDLSSASKIEASVQATTCKIDMSSASKAELSGSARNCTAELSSAAKLSAEKMIVADYDISTSSGSKAEINCTEKLLVHASSGSAVYYTGECSGEINRSSGGKVTKN